MNLQKHKSSFSFKAITLILALSLIFPPQAFSQGVPLNLPAPGSMVSLSQGFTPTLLKGLKIYPDNPLKFDFIVDTGDEKLEGEALKKTSEQLIKYFLASLTVPEKELWVNLSPYEKDKIIPQSFGETEMGRDLLAQDYLLKQLTASLIYPENNLGKEFWNRVYKKAKELYGTAEIPINTFNKVWIVPDKAVVYAKDDRAFVTQSHFKVMLEEDYLSLNQNLNNKQIGTNKLEESKVKEVNNISSQIIKELVLPEIEKEVNSGKNFALLRQVQNSLILAVWYKKALKESLLSKVYVNQHKTKGIDLEDKQTHEKIYNQYLQALKKGVFNYIKEDYDSSQNKTVPRKYFSGGVRENVEEILELTGSEGDVRATTGGTYTVQTALDSRIPENPPKPTFGFSGNDVDHDFIEAQQAIVAGNSSKAQELVARAIKLFKETDVNAVDQHGYGIADVINQVEVAIWGLAQLQQTGNLSEEGQLLLKLLQEGKNGEEIKKALIAINKKKIQEDRRIPAGVAKLADGAIGGHRGSTTAEAKKIEDLESNQNVKDNVENDLDVQQTKFGLIEESHLVYQAIDQIFQKILMAAGLEGAGIKLHLVNSDEVDAYWIIDSKTFVLSLGFLKTLNRYLGEQGKRGITQDMIAWVLAHEVRHLTQSLEREDQPQESKPKSRKHELQVAKNLEYDADGGALFLAAFAGYNPSAAVEVLKFLDAVGDVPLFRTHGKADNRVGEIQKILQSPDHFLPNMTKAETSFDPEFLTDPLIQNRTKAEAFHEKMLAAQSTDELALLIDEVDDPTLLEELYIHYYFMMLYEFSDGLTQDPNFQQYASFVLTANNILDLIMSRTEASSLPGKTAFIFSRDWDCPTYLTKLFRFFNLNKTTKNQPPLTLGSDPNVPKEKIIEQLEKKIDEAISEISTNDVYNRKEHVLPILKILRQNLRSLLEEAQRRPVDRVNKIHSEDRKFTKFMVVRSQEDIPEELKPWVYETDVRNDGMLRVEYIDKEAILNDFESFWQFFLDIYDQDRRHHYQKQATAVMENPMLGLKAWFKKRYGELELPENLFNLETDGKNQGEVENDRIQFLKIYLRFLAFHFLKQQMGPFQAVTRTQDRPVVPHDMRMRNKARELIQKRFEKQDLDASSIDFLTMVTYTALFRGFNKNFDQELNSLVDSLGIEQVSKLLEVLYSSAPYYLSSMPHALEGMFDYQKEFKTVQLNFAASYFDAIKSLLAKKASLEQKLGIEDLTQVMKLVKKLEFRLGEDIRYSKELKETLQLIWSDFLADFTVERLNLLTDEINVINRWDINEMFLEFICNKHFSKNQYQEKIAVLKKLFPTDEVSREKMLEILFETVEYGAMNETVKKDFLEEFLPLFVTDEGELDFITYEEIPSFMGISLGSKKSLHQQLSRDYMHLLKKDGVGLVELIERINRLGAVVTRFDLIVDNQKEWKELFFDDVRKIIRMIKASTNGYQKYQSAIGAIALAKLREGIPTFLLTEETAAGFYNKRIPGKNGVALGYPYQEAMEDQGDFLKYLIRLAGKKSAKEQWLFEGRTFEESLGFVMEFLPASEERDKILLSLISDFNQPDEKIAELLDENVSPGKNISNQRPEEDKEFAKIEVPTPYGSSVRSAVSDNMIRTILGLKEWDGNESAENINVEKDVAHILETLREHLPPSLKGTSEVEEALTQLGVQLSDDIGDLKSMNVREKFANGRFGVANSINSRIIEFAHRYLIKNNPHFDYFNIRNFGLGGKKFESVWKKYQSLREFFWSKSNSLLEKLRKLTEFFPEKTRFRDNELERWLAIEESRITGKPLSVLVQAVNLQGVRHESYEMVSVEGLDVNQITPDQARQLITAYKEVLPLMSDGWHQITLGRKIFELEKWFSAEIFKDFDQGLAEILSIFPKYSLARDNVLNEFINSDSVQNLDQIRKILKYILQEQRLAQDDEIVQSALHDELWNTVNKFPSRKEKSDFILWLLAPAKMPMPESLAKVAAANYVNFDSLPKIVFSMTKVEREKFFYDFLRGYNGLFEVDPKSSTAAEDQATLENFTGQLFDALFTTDELGEATSLVRDIFTTVFLNYSTERQILLFNALLGVFATSEGNASTRAQKIRILLEQMGVIGVKVGQYLSEQPQLLKDAPDILEELKNLKKNATSFHKRAIFQLLQEAGLFGEVELLLRQLGAASIKQVYEILLSDDIKAAGKFMRPAAEKFLAEDLKVLTVVLTMINNKYPQLGIPAKMLDDIKMMLDEELRFEQEAVNAEQFQQNLDQRDSLQRGGFTIRVPKIFRHSQYVILEELVHGITIADFILIKKDPSLLSREEQLEREKIEKNLQENFTEEEHVTLLSYDLNALSKILVEEFFFEAFNEGFFHADLHLGNAMVTPNKEIYMIDLGAAGHIQEQNIQTMLNLLVVMDSKNADWLISLLEPFLSKQIKATPKINSEIFRIVNAKIRLEDKFKQLIKIIEEFELVGNKELMVYLRGLGTVSPMIENLTDQEKNSLVKSYLTTKSKLKFLGQKVKSFIKSPPKPTFGFSGNDVDHDFIEAQQVLIAGDTAKATGLIAHAIQVFRETDINATDGHGYPIADVINQDEVAVWTLQELQAAGNLSEEGQLLLRLLQEGKNGQAIKEALRNPASIGETPSGNAITNQPQPAAELEKGGIDLNPAQLNLQRQGNNMPFQIPSNPAEWQNLHIEGFVPIIIKITPVTNLPLLLGTTQNTTAETQKLSLVR